MEKKLTLNIVIPVYNEEKELEDSIARLVHFLSDNLDDFVWKITIVDNASIDSTYQKALALSKKFGAVQAVHLTQKGRGRAVKYAWTHDATDIVAYMDVDLSTDLKHFPPLVHSLTAGYDIAIGSRNLPKSHVYGRSQLRTITSKCYILLIRILFWVNFTDAQCGFKAVTKKVVQDLLPRVVDDEWFFDTELLILAEKMDYRIYEEPVTWVDNPGSTVRVLHTALGDLKGLWRLFLTRTWR